MEILIVGILLVALMVYVSTRIKKSAARAYEREKVETEEFKLIKPENFIIPLNENSKFAFQARAKDFGENEASNTPQAKIELNVFTNSNFQNVCKDKKKSADKILSEQQSEDLSKQKICRFETEKTEDEIAFSSFHKIVEDKKRNKVYDLNVSVVKDFLDSYKEKVSEVLESFVVK